MGKIKKETGWTKSLKVFAALLVSLFFSSVVTTSDSPRYMPCQDKSTIQLKSSVLSVDVWRVLSPGGPIFNSVSSNGFFCVCVSLCFLSLEGGTANKRHRRTRRSTASSKWLCRELQRCDVSEHVIARGGKKTTFVSGAFTTWPKWAYLSAWREIRRGGK